MNNKAQTDSAQPFDPDILIDALPGPAHVAIALHLARQGLPVFPCKASGPNVKSPHTAHGFRDATCDPATIEAWWRQWPSALVGFRTGSASGIAVLDLDVKNGKDGIAAARSRGIDPETASPMIQQTLSGTGRHLYFRHSDGQEYRQDGAAGIDVKGEPA
ncbi:bifunctional DNA primase/polymerase [Roseovarius indicus]|uniref:bifunctional DNA primase/polymerase n=1 Tax=Roseovarius indicus TaxID=540747 RepID=UPI004057F148|tara:strand:+ start:182 stop:661 length:480 start_codon:yes stop_codon:yes gene_type:complete